MSDNNGDQTTASNKNHHVIEMHDVLTDSESEPSTIVVTDSETTRDPNSPNERHSNVVCEPQMCRFNNGNQEDIEWFGTYYRRPVFTIQREPRAGFCQRLLNSMGFRLSDRET
ncbi:hypothetical protein M3Y95_00962900 [Aphelenchoides besseyi]|nr:hypothetical protein M3Y95_00962900 [Aphelenchoides besseyi]